MAGYTITRHIMAGTAIIIIPAAAITFMIAIITVIAGMTRSAVIGRTGTRIGTANARAMATGIAFNIVRPPTRAVAARGRTAATIPVAAIGAVDSMVMATMMAVTGATAAAAIADRCATRPSAG